MREYEILNPSGNITALVTEDVPREKYKEISDEIMKNDPNIEQVGFLKNIQIRSSDWRWQVLNFVEMPQEHSHVFL